MITVKTDNKNLMLECDAGIAGDVLYTLSAYKPTHTGTNKVCITVSMDYINQINKDLAKYKGKLILDSSFIEWKEKYAGKTPLLIRAGVTFSKIYKTKVRIQLKIAPYPWYYHRYPLWHLQI